MFIKIADDNEFNYWGKKLSITTISFEEFLSWGFHSRVATTQCGLLSELRFSGPHFLCYKMKRLHCTQDGRRTAALLLLEFGNAGLPVSHRPARRLHAKTSWPDVLWMTGAWIVHVHLTDALVYCG